MNIRPGSGFGFLRRTVSLTTCWGQIPVRKRRGAFTIWQGVEDRALSLHLAPNRTICHHRSSISAAAVILAAHTCIRTSRCVTN
jgi:hypothetical protein